MDHETLRQPQPALHTGQQVDVHCQCFRGPLSQALQLLSGTGVGCNDIGCGWGHRYWWATSLSLLTTPLPPPQGEGHRSPPLSANPVYPLFRYTEAVGFLSQYFYLLQPHFSLPSSSGTPSTVFFKRLCQRPSQKMKRGGVPSNTNLTHKQEHISVG